MATESKGSNLWRQKAGTLLNSSSTRFKELASKAGTAAAGAAEVTGSKMKTTWATTRQEWNTKVQPRVSASLETAARVTVETGSKLKTGLIDARDKAAASKMGQQISEDWNTKVQPRMSAGLETAARVTSETGTKLKTGFIEVRDKAAATKVGQQITETTRASFARSRTLLSRVDFRQNSRKDPDAVFGVPLEELVHRQMGGQSVPRVVALCSEYLKARGLTTGYLFENEGDSQVVMRLMRLFDQDGNASIPLGTSSLDVAQLLMVYFRSLPEPILSYQLYDAIVEVGGTNVQRLRTLIASLPIVNQACLECIIELLLRVSEKSAFNKMDARRLATEFAPLLLWRKGAPGSLSATPGSLPRVKSSKSDSDLSEIESPRKTSKESPLLDNGAAPSVLSSRSDESNGIEPESKSPPQIPANEEPSREQWAIVEAVLCFIEQHEAIFTNLRPTVAA